MSPAEGMSLLPLELREPRRHPLPSALSAFIMTVEGS